MYSLQEIAQHIDAEIVGDPETQITGIATIQNAQPGEITHLSSSQYREHLKSTNASAVILAQRDAQACPVNALVVANPSFGYAQTSQLFDDRVPIPIGISSKAELDSTVVIGTDVRVGPFVSIGSNVELGDRVEIAAGCQIGADCRIGNDTVVMGNVTLYHNVKIGSRCMVHANSAIGADGFGFTPDVSGKLEKVAQLGGVTIGDDVVIGASNTIDRGAIEDTVIEDGVKLDDQVHIGHNCRVGAHSMLCGCAGLGGSVTIGRHCILGGGVGVAGSGPLTIADGTQIGAMTYVSRSILKPGIYAGSTLHTPIQTWRRNSVRLAELDTFVKRITRLEKQQKHET